MEKIAETSVMSEERENFQLKYYLICEETCFGVFAEMILENEIVDSDSVTGLFETRDEGIKLIKILADNTVTPFVLTEIIDEMLS